MKGVHSALHSTHFLRTREIVTSSNSFEFIILKIVCTICACNRHSSSDKLKPTQPNLTFQLILTSVDRNMFRLKKFSPQKKEKEKEIFNSNMLLIGLLTIYMNF